MSKNSMAQTSRHPICIASPVRRSGTTLIQRLFCSSPNALAFGESCANDFNLLANIVSTKELMLAQSKDYRNYQLESVLEGKVNDWIPDLLPEIDEYLDAQNDMIRSLSKFYSDYALKKNRPIWGMKMPEWNPSGLLLIKKILPETKVIYLRRNLTDCVRSAKKIDMLRDLNEVQRFCQLYKQFLDYAQVHLVGDDIMYLNYEDLVSDPAQWISKIEAFTGVTNMDPNVMKVKVNTYNNDPKLATENSTYLEPSTLSQEELDIISTFSITEVTSG